MELSRLWSQLWPFSSRVEDASAIPARSIHSASDLDFVESAARVRMRDGATDTLFGLRWWRGCARLRLWRFVSLNGARVELLLRVWWRVWELLREWERIGGVLGTEMLDR